MSNRGRLLAATARSSFIVFAFIVAVSQGVGAERDRLMLFGNPFPRAGSSPVFGVGFQVGYSSVSMSSVNDALRESAGIFRTTGAEVPPADQLAGGLYMTGSVRLLFQSYDVGFLVSTVSANAAIAFDDGTESLREEYGVRTTEVLGMFNWRLMVRRDVAVIFGLAAGYAIASGEYQSRFVDYFNPANDERVVHELAKNYIAGRISAGVQLGLPVGFLELTGGYRVSDAGVPKGRITRNGVQSEEEPRRSRGGVEIEFDYSGLFASAGISLTL